MQSLSPGAIASRIPGYASSCWTRSENAWLAGSKISTEYFSLCRLEKPPLTRTRPSGKRVFVRYQLHPAFVLGTKLRSALDGLGGRPVRGSGGAPRILEAPGPVA